MEIVIPIITAVAGLFVGAGGIYAYNKKKENGGKNKADAVHDMVCGDISEHCPASILQLHSDVTLVLDKEAASKLDESVISQAI